MSSNGNLQYISFYEINLYEFKATDTQLTKEPSKNNNRTGFPITATNKKRGEDDPSLSTSTQLTTEPAPQ